MTEEHWILWPILAEYKKRLTENHTDSTGVRESWAPCLGGVNHERYRAVGDDFTVKFQAKPDDWRDGEWYDKYELREFDTGEVNIKAFCCVLRACNLNKTKEELEKGKEYLTPSDLDYLLINAAIEYIHKDDEAL